MPASEETILYFVAYLHSQQICLATIKVYLAGISNLHAENNVSCPHNTRPVGRLLDGIRRTSAATTDERAPITLSDMRMLKESLRKSKLSSHDQAAYWCAFCFALFGALRVSEYTSPKPTEFDATRSLSTDDISTAASSLSIRLRKSKTDQFGHGYVISLEETNRSICAVSTYRHYQLFRNKFSSEPLFIDSNGAFLNRNNIEKAIRKFLPASPGKKHTSHSFRIGAGTLAASQGASTADIQQTGRWKSSAFTSYVRSQVPIRGLKPY